MKTLLAAIALALSLPAAVQAEATAWPAKTVRIVVPYAAGSTPDAIARLIFDRVQKATGKTMVVENKPGAAGMIGADQAAKATPDGHTLVLAPSGPLATNGLLYRKMPYDPLKDLAPVALVAETPTILVASNATPANNAQALLKAMADPKNRMAYASPGAGTLGHLNMAYLVARSGATDVPHVPYAGSPQIVTALVANDVQLAALPPLAVAPFVKAGKIKAIATIGPRRSSALPDVPTLKESGIDFAPVGWFGVATTAGTPPEVLEAIHKQVAQALKDPEVAAAYRAQGLDVVDKGPKAFGVYIAEEVARWKPVIQRFGIALD
ncbi:Bug family tripartite tricarboxylate transporter substrate binding protein [Ramlibacter agri]|uniref:Bug family tripartite tricarboxylate transporter substrate binding protein n=1 Tax=Ramlibacter agri TaxID=2728837 RepID=UPI001F0F937B|nr:tripartite tricarboxylate transporter substrate binding protein [Ramlibacter agri]